MRFDDIITEVLLIEAVSKPTGPNGGIILLDIDDTLLSAQGMFIYRLAEIKDPITGEMIKHPDGLPAATLTPAQYAQEKVTPETKEFYDYRDFRNADKVSSSIKIGLPIIKNLKIMDAYINAGWKIGILTARGMEDVIHSSLKFFLKVRNSKGKLKGVGDKLVRDYVHAVNDDNKVYKGKTDYHKKQNVIKGYIEKYGENNVKFLDDDHKNLVYAREVMPSKNAIQAHPAR